MKYTYIGDAHGKIARLREITDEYPGSDRVIQLGDMGFGFRHLPDALAASERFPENFYYIRGNHDSPTLARINRSYLGDFGQFQCIIENQNVRSFFLGGAFSIDYMWRVPGKTWWNDEELSYTELESAISLYKAVRPEIMITHECPADIIPVLLAGLGGDYHAAKASCQESRTSLALQAMLDEWQPRYWFFGHHHVSKDIMLPVRNWPTYFQCLNELDAVTLEINNGITGVPDYVLGPVVASGSTLGRE